MSWLLEGWSAIYRLTDRVESPWFESCEDRAGVYRLIALDSEDVTAPASLGRVCGHDQTGTIYVGASKSLKHRIGRLVMTHDPAFAAKKHKPLPAKLLEVYPPHRLGISFKYVANKDLVFAEEALIISSYKENFGEPPPLNGQG